MTSMKKLIAVLLMVLVIGCAVFAEAHKKQIIVTYTMSTSEKSFSEIKKATVIPEGWHVVQIVCIPSQKSYVHADFLIVLEEN